MKKVLVILGPTASGKTDLGLILAKIYHGEIIACDSRQVYKGLDIGTGKLPLDEGIRIIRGEGFWELDGVKIWLYDLVNPWEQFSVKYYLNKAQSTLQDILKREKIPIIVGGTGLYLKALIEGLSNLDIPIDLKLRQKLQLMDLSDLQEEFKTRDFKNWEALNHSERMNKRRLIRHLELVIMYPYKRNKRNEKLIVSGYDFFKIGLTAPRLVLNQRIDQRLEKRINRGMIEEAEGLLRVGISLDRMKELGLEYKYLAMLLNQELGRQQFMQILKIKIHQYAKRQMTWFKRDKDTHWVDITDPQYLEQVEKILKIWYHPGDE